MDEQEDVKAGQPRTRPDAGWHDILRRLERDPSWALAAAEELAHQACREQPLDRPASPSPTIGSYRIVRELGRGGQAVVFLARDERLGRDVALKILPWNTGPAEQQRLRREAEITARLDLPQVCKVYEVGRFEGATYAAMQFVAGVPLAERIRGAGGVGPVELGTGASRSGPIDRVLRFVAKVARAVHRVHLEGVVHRDLKPANIMVTTEGEPVVLDFGLARTDDHDLESLTATGDVFGTPAYMAPELLGDEPRSADRSSDVWALGCILWELLFGCRPFEAPTRSALLEAIRTQPLQPGRRRLPGLAPEVEAILEAALERDLSRRYATAGALADDLERVLQRLPVSVRKASWTLRARRAVQRHPLGYATAALGVLFFTVTPTLVAVQAMQNEVEVRKEQERAEMLAVFAFDAISDTLVELGRSALARLPGEVERRRRVLNRAEELLRPIETEPALEKRVAAQTLRIHFELARLGEGTRRNDDALRHMRRVLELLERYPDIALATHSRNFAEHTARTWVATALMREGDVAGALRELDAAAASEALRGNPFYSAELNLHRAEIAADLRQWGACLRIADTAVEHASRIEPDFESLMTPGSLPLLWAGIRHVRGRALRRGDRLEEARAEFDRGVESMRSIETGRFDFLERTDLAELLESRANILRLLEQHDAARADIDETVAIYSDLHGLTTGQPDYRFLEGQARVIRIEVLHAAGAEKAAVAEIRPTVELLAGGAQDLSASAHLSLATAGTLQRLGRATGKLIPRDRTLRAEIHAAAWGVGVAGLEASPRHAKLAAIVSPAARDHAYWLRKERDVEGAVEVLQRMAELLVAAVGDSTEVVSAAERFRVLRDLAGEQARLRQFAASHETAHAALGFAERAVREQGQQSKSVHAYPFVALRVRLAAAFELGRWDEIAAACDDPMRFVPGLVEAAADDRKAGEILTHPLYTGSERLVEASVRAPDHLRLRLALALLRLNARLHAMGSEGWPQWARTRSLLTARWVRLFGAGLRDLAHRGRRSCK